jgi:hypothetical protein
MNSVIRRCPKCGHDDLRKQWSSIDDAIDNGALSATWACPSCSWPEAVLVEVDRPVTVPDDARFG